jgi:inhibitor of cysteine peptidase
LGAANAGQRVEVGAGQQIEVTLAANPTTGYTWAIRSVDESVLRPVGEPAFTPQSELAGAPGAQVMRFEAVATGETTLTLGYLRPWESVPPLETYSVDVVVR